MRKLGYAARTVALIALAGTVTACEGNRLAGLETTGSATLRVTKKSTKEQQIETIKREMAREGVAPDKAASVEKALVNVKEVHDPGEQAVFLLAALAEALSAPGADEGLKAQLSNVVLGAAAELGLSLEPKEGSAAGDGTREGLLKAAAASLTSQGVPATTIVAAASRQLLAEPEATSESVSALVKSLPAAAELPSEKVTELISAEVEKREASTRPCLEPSFVTSGQEYHCPDGSQRVGTQPTAAGDTSAPSAQTLDPELTPEASNIVEGVTILGVSGTARIAPPVCSAERDTDCVASDNFPAIDLSALDASQILLGTSVGGVNGTASGRPADCAQSGEIGCVTTGDHPAVRASEVVAENLVAGTTLLGIAGTALVAPPGLGDAPWNGSSPPTHDPTLAQNAGCPAGYALVPPRRETGIGLVNYPFLCVAKYSMRAVYDADGSAADTTTRISPTLLSPSLDPSLATWVRISLNESELECRGLGEGYRLINNNEWQSIALLSEQMGVNWETGIVGSGMLYKGVADRSITNTNDPYDNTGAAATDPFGAGKELRRTVYLPNGEVLWDFFRGREWVQPVDRLGNIITIGATDPEFNGDMSSTAYSHSYDSIGFYELVVTNAAADDTTNVPPSYLAVAPWMMLPGILTENVTALKYDLNGTADLTNHGNFGTKDEALMTKGLMRGNGPFDFSIYEFKTNVNWSGTTFRCVYTTL